MAYQDLIFNNLAGKVVGIYNDNNLQRDVEVPLVSARRIIATGTATAGARNELFNVRSINTAMQTFGNDSEIATIIQRVANINTNFNLSVMRIGSKPFHWRLKQDIAGSYEKQPLISIVPVFVQEKDATQNIFSTLENLKIVLMPFIDNNVIRQRVILFNHDRNPDSTNAIYDSERLLVANGEVAFEVTIDVPYGTVLYTPNAFNASTQIGNGYTDAELATLSEVSAFLTDNMTILSDETNFDTNIFSINTIDRTIDTLNGISGYDLDIYAGKSQKKLNHCERYINNEEAYRVLEFQNADFLYCEGCFADIKPVSLIGKNAAFALNWASENLGYLWKYVFNGRSYSYMFRTAEPFTNTLVTNTYTNDGVTYNFSASNKLLGDLLNLVEIHLHPKAQGTATDIETFSNEKGIIECHVEFDSDPAAIVDAHSLTEAEFETYASDFAADANTDVYGWTLANFNLLAAVGGTAFVSDNDATLPRDTRTGLIEAQHDALMADAAVIAYLAGAHSIDASTDSKGRTEADYDTYVAAGFQGTITLQTPFCELQFSASKFDADEAVYTKRLRPSLIDTSDAVSALLRNGDSGNNDPFVISHWDMAQDEIPEAVIARLINFPETGASAATLVASNLEVREVSFLHQVAQAAYQASSNYNHTVGLVPTSHPAASKTGLHVWAGNPAEYEVKEDGSIVVTKNGTGILGNKLLAGEVGYRDSAAFGGIILTNGEDLPNDLPYGIDDSDEALDANNNPIDLGKHIVVVGSYGYVPDPRNSFTQNRGKVSRSNPFNNPLYVNAGPSIAQILADLPPGNEPIGPVNGAVAGFNNRMQTPRQILNNLAALRVCMIGQDSVISSIYTAALRTSDYTKISSIISSNEILKRVRQYAAPVLGQALSDATINSLDTTMLGLSNALKNEGYAQACRIQLRASRLDRINGVLNARVSFVPPFSLETINVDITLEAPAV
jgi:hypothetical protein